MLGIPRTTFYRWYDLYHEGGLDGLSDKPSRPGSVWNRIPDTRRDDLIEFALEHEALSLSAVAYSCSIFDQPGACNVQVLEYARLFGA